MPMMPPLQMSMPALRAACKVRSLSSCVCVLHRVGKKEGAVSRLQW